MADRAKKIAARPNVPTVDGAPLLEGDDGGWEVMRISLPLDRIHEVGMEDYMDFARLLSVDIDVMEDDANGNLCVTASNEWDRLTPSNPYPQHFERDNSRQGPSGLQKIGNLFKRGSNKKGQNGQATPPAEADAAAKTDRHSLSASESATPHIHHTGNLGKPAVHHHKLTGSGAFKGAPEDPDNLTSNTSIVPPGAHVEEDGAGRSQVRTTVNIKFGILYERADFVETIHQTIQRSEAASRRYKAGIIRPTPIFQVGLTNLLELREVEGGAGLSNPGAGIATLYSAKKSSHHKHGGDAHLSSDDSDSDSDATEYTGDPGGIRVAKKRQNAEIAKAIFGIPAHDTVWMKRCYLNQTVPFRGHIILSEKFLCFWRKQAGPIPDIKVSCKGIRPSPQLVELIGFLQYRFPVHDVKGAENNEHFRMKFRGMSVMISGRHDLHFEFFSPRSRSHVGHLSHYPSTKKLVLTWSVSPQTIKRINQLVEAHAKFHEEHPDLGERDQEKDQERARSAAIANTVDINEYATKGEHHAQRRERQRNINLLGVSPDATMSVAVPDRALAHLPAIVNDFGGRRKISPRKFALL